MRRWGLAGLTTALGILLAARQLTAGSPVPAALFFLIFAGLAVLVSPGAFPRSVTDAEARQRSAADGRPIVYWRPGCPFCIRLRASLGRDVRRLHWVDIWTDPDGAASVRAVTGGDETVPTVIAAEGFHVNPAPGLVRGLLRGVR
ncbi:glutaredoxin domain-containing protein [Micromonosporaceae bacterium Da 78-11]